MSWYSRLLSPWTQKSSSGSQNPAQWFIDWIRNGLDTLSGVAVTVSSALSLSAVWACVRVRSEDVGKCPTYLYRVLEGGGKEKATDHYLYNLILKRPNPRMTAFEFKQVMQANLDLRGNAYALKERDSRGRVIALWPVNPANVVVLMGEDRRELFYRVTFDYQPIPTDTSTTAPGLDSMAGNAGIIIFTEDDMMHLRGLSLNGVTGLSPIAYHRETIGLGIAQQRYGAAFFGNSAQPSGALKMPTTIGKEAAELLRADWEQRYKGVENAKKLAIFDGGMEWVQTGMDNTDAQYLEGRGFQNREVWRMYRMPPHKVSDLDKATNNNIEQQALEYVTDCLLTEFVRWEQTLHTLLLEKEKDLFFFEFDAEIMLRGDFKSRMDGFALGRNWGLFNADECRDRIGYNPIPGGKGKIYLQPLNMIEAGTTPPTKPPDKNTPGEEPPLSPKAAKELIKYLSIIVARSEAEDVR